VRIGEKEERTESQSESGSNWNCDASGERGLAHRTTRSIATSPPGHEHAYRFGSSSRAGRSIIFTSRLGGGRLESVAALERGLGRARRGRGALARGGRGNSKGQMDTTIGVRNPP